MSSNQWIKQERNGKIVLVREDVRECKDQIEWDMKIAQFSEGGPSFLTFIIYRLYTREGDGMTIINSLESLTLEGRLSPEALRQFAAQCELLIGKHGAIKRTWGLN